MTNDVAGKEGWGGIRKIHFVGLGGIGMSGIAEIALRSGWAVSGSDLSDSPALERLQRLGAHVYLGHHKENLGDAEMVVFSSAVPQENPEILEARSRGFPVIHRAEMLAWLMRPKKGITVTGTHGKTTTASMIAHLLREAGLDPTAVVGGHLKALGSSAIAGQGEFFVAEADESDRSFLQLEPLYTVVTNIDLDHMDQYRDLADLRQAFLEHMNQVPTQGAVVACEEDPNLQPLLKKVHRRVIAYGWEQKAGVSACRFEAGSFRSRYECLHQGHSLGHIELAVPGRHNALNSLGAVSVGLLLGIPFTVIRRSLKTFQGVARRMEHKGDRRGVQVVDDYGHHPSEVRATLEACQGTGRRLMVVFQPHRYSRTQYLMRDLGTCFEGADHLYLLDIYPAGEDPIPGITSRRLAAEIRHHREVTYLPDKEAVVKLLENETVAGDMILTLGAGDVWKVGESFLAEPHQPQTE